MNCSTCFKETNNPRFCSRSCAATWNNTISPKRKRTAFCKVCSSPIRREATYCSRICQDSNRRCFRDCTLSELKADVCQTRNSYVSYVRYHARAELKRANPRMECSACGYSVHVQACHIKPVSDFELTARISEVNDLRNLIWLCPNHHWELDNGYLVLPVNFPEV